jgi:hypothetical protein
MYQIGGNASFGGIQTGWVHGVSDRRCMCIRVWCVWMWCCVVERFPIRQWVCEHLEIWVLCIYSAFIADKIGNLDGWQRLLNVAFLFLHIVSRDAYFPTLHPMPPKCGMQPPACELGVATCLSCHYLSPSLESYRLVFSTPTFEQVLPVGRNACLRAFASIG